MAGLDGDGDFEMLEFSRSLRLVSLKLFLHMLPCCSMLVTLTRTLLHLSFISAQQWRLT
jgi:hypothetical protein